MKKSRTERFFNLITINFLIVALCSSSAIPLYSIHLSFDSFFPVTWYQKGLESSLSVWQILVDLFQSNGEIKKAVLDELLGKLVFAQFCINRMKQEKVSLIAEDKNYLVMVLRKVKNLVEMMVVTEENKDFVMCVQEIVLSMQQQLLKF